VGDRAASTLVADGNEHGSHGNGRGTGGAIDFTLRTLPSDTGRSSGTNRNGRSSNGRNGNGSTKPHSNGDTSLGAANDISSDRAAEVVDRGGGSIRLVTRSQARVGEIGPAGLALSVEPSANAEGPADPPGGVWYRILKRALDIVVSITALLALSPLLAAVAIAIKCTSRGPVFFTHSRQGRGGREFPCIKFRSMKRGADALQSTLREINEVDGPQFKLANDPRLTRLGKFLRDTNIDELPQLINVLLGHMSLVGPRPSPDCENQLCPLWRRARLSVRPGITGLWQVLRLRDPKHSDFQEWIYYDTEYVRHQSLGLDLQLILYTPVSMFAGRRLTGLARRLARRGVCRHSPRLQQDRRCVFDVYPTIDQCQRHARADEALRVVGGRGPQ
jgi:lipopolysaccharide/colanic/teichoic acid biosynthesis glycosyltransferase